MVKLTTGTGRTLLRARGKDASGLGERLRLLKLGTSVPAAIALSLAPAGLAHAEISNTATATGNPPSGPPVTDNDTVDVTVDPAAPALTVVKTGTFTDNADIGAEPGDVITYTYTVTNSGNTTLNNIDLTDVHDGAGTAPNPTFVSLTDNGAVGDSSDDGTGTYDILAPGDTLTYSATYTVVQADVDGGGGGSGPTAGDNDIDNVATADGIYDPAGGPPDGSPDEVPVSGSASEAVDLFVNQGITIVKTVSDSTDVVVGQTLTYTYTVTNTGNTNLADVTVTETAFNGTGTPPSPTLTSITNTSGNSADDAADQDVDILAPGDVAIFTATYTVTQQDIDTLQ